MVTWSRFGALNFYFDSRRFVSFWKMTSRRKTSKKVRILLFSNIVKIQTEIFFSIDHRFED